MIVYFITDIQPISYITTHYVPNHMKLYVYNEKQNKIEFMDSRIKKW